MFSVRTAFINGVIPFCAQPKAAQLREIGDGPSCLFRCKMVQRKIEKLQARHLFQEFQASVRDPLRTEHQMRHAGVRQGREGFYLGGVPHRVLEAETPEGGSGLYPSMLCRRVKSLTHWPFSEVFPLISQSRSIRWLANQ